jgi:thiol-disulfide isomerase/thioredoxin
MASKTEASKTEASKTESNTKSVVTELNVSQLQALQKSMHASVIVIKFGAEWCGPCKAIAPAYKEFMAKAPMNILFADIDVDENLDLYMALKKQKMIKGIPVFLAFFGGVKRDAWFIPDDSVVGADPEAVGNFFKRCSAKAVDFLRTQPADYTYFS